MKKVVLGVGLLFFGISFGFTQSCQYNVSVNEAFFDLEGEKNDYGNIYYAPISLNDPNGKKIESFDIKILSEHTGKTYLGIRGAMHGGSTIAQPNTKKINSGGATGFLLEFYPDEDIDPSDLRIELSNFNGECGSLVVDTFKIKPDSHKYVDIKNLKLTPQSSDKNHVIIQGEFENKYNRELHLNTMNINFNTDDIAPYIGNLKLQIDNVDVPIGKTSISNGSSLYKIVMLENVNAKIAPYSTINFTLSFDAYASFADKIITTISVNTYDEMGMSFSDYTKLYNEEFNIIYKQDDSRFEVMGRLYDKTSPIHSVNVSKKNLHDGVFGDPLNFFMAYNNPGTQSLPLDGGPYLVKFQALGVNGEKIGLAEYVAYTAGKEKKISEKSLIGNPTEREVTLTWDTEKLLGYNNEFVDIYIRGIGEDQFKKIGLAAVSEGKFTFNVVKDGVYLINIGNKDGEIKKYDFDFPLENSVNIDVTPDLFSLDKDIIDFDVLRTFVGSKVLRITGINEETMETTNIQLSYKLKNHTYTTIEPKSHTYPYTDFWLAGQQNTDFMVEAVNDKFEVISEPIYFTFNEAEISESKTKTGYKSDMDLPMVYNKYDYQTKIIPGVVSLRSEMIGKETIRLYRYGDDDAEGFDQVVIGYNTMGEIPRFGIDPFVDLNSMPTNLIGTRPNDKSYVDIRVPGNQALVFYAKGFSNDNEMIGNQQELVLSVDENKSGDNLNGYSDFDATIIEDVLQNYLNNILQTEEPIVNKNLVTNVVSDTDDTGKWSFVDGGLLHPYDPVVDSDSVELSFHDVLYEGKSVELYTIFFGTESLIEESFPETVREFIVKPTIQGSKLTVKLPGLESNTKYYAMIVPIDPGNSAVIPFDVSSNEFEFTTTRERLVEFDDLLNNLLQEDEPRPLVITPKTSLRQNNVVKVLNNQLVFNDPQNDKFTAYEVLLRHQNSLEYEKFDLKVSDKLNYALMPGVSFVKIIGVTNTGEKMLLDNFSVRVEGEQQTASVITKQVVEAVKKRLESYTTKEQFDIITKLDTKIMELERTDVHWRYKNKIFVKDLLRELKSSYNQ